MSNATLSVPIAPPTPSLPRVVSKTRLRRDGGGGESGEVEPDLLRGEGRAGREYGEDDRASCCGRAPPTFLTLPLEGGGPGWG